MAEITQRQEGIALVGSGSATPIQRITNDQLSSRVDTNDAWIHSRTGISERRISGPEENLSELSYKAAALATQMAGWDPNSIDLVFCIVFLTLLTYDFLMYDINLNVRS